MLARFGAVTSSRLALSTPRPNARSEPIRARAQRPFWPPSHGGAPKTARRGSDCASCCIENALWDAGVLHVAGVDEAGMSPLAGPVAAAAVIFEPGSRIPGVDDLKKLDAATRDKLAVEIKGRALAWSVAFAEVEEIDRVNIYWAGLLAMRRAVEALLPAPQHILIDARRLKELTTPQQAIVKGDSKSLTIAAASILAKTARDALMCKLDAEHPGYGFSKHKGYPVREHVAALERLGASPCSSPVFRAGPQRARPAAAPAMAERGGSLGEGSRARATGHSGLVTFCPRRGDFRDLDWAVLLPVRPNPISIKDKPTCRRAFVRSKPALSTSRMKKAARVRMALHSRPRVPL